MGSFSCSGPLGWRRMTVVLDAQFVPPSTILPSSVLSLPGAWTPDFKSPVNAIAVDSEQAHPFPPMKAVVMAWKRIPSSVMVDVMFSTVTL